MKPQEIINEIQGAFQGALARAVETDAGWLIEVIHQQCGTLGSSAFRRRIEQALKKVPNPNPPTMVWKLFVYPDEENRYLSQGTLHTLPSSQTSGMHTVTLSENDVYLDIPEFDSELLSFSNYRGHLIPALVTIDANKNAIFPYQAVQYRWLEALGGEYTIQNTTNAGNLNGRQRIDVQL